MSPELGDLEMLDWVADMRAKEAEIRAGVEDYFGVWKFRWSVSRVDVPSRYRLEAERIDPTSVVIQRDRALLMQIAEAFGAPLTRGEAEEGAMSADYDEGLDWSWPGDDDE